MLYAYITINAFSAKTWKTCNLASFRLTPKKCHERRLCDNIQTCSETYNCILPFYNIQSKPFIPYFTVLVVLALKCKSHILTTDVKVADGIFQNNA